MNRFQFSSHLATFGKVVPKGKTALRGEDLQKNKKYIYKIWAHENYKDFNNDFATQKMIVKKFFPFEN